MKNYLPILIIEYDSDDCELIQFALKDIGVDNEQKCFRNGQEALEYLQSTSEKTFMILSDVNMPMLNGFELKDKINSDDRLRKQSIHFVFLSTSDTKKDVNRAYDMAVQGFFKKPQTYEEIKDLLKMVTNYRDICKNHNSN